MRLSQNGVNFIKSHEALRLKAYQDSKGVWTIGWGHTKNVHPGDVIHASRPSSLSAMILHGLSAH